MKQRATNAQIKFEGMSHSLFQANAGGSGRKIITSVLKKINDKMLKQTPETVFLTQRLF